MAEINPIKLQKPLKDKEGSFYPLTTYDQIVMPDNSRWNGVVTDERAVFVDRTGATAGIPALVNADTLGGIAASEYALKDDASSSLPSGGVTGNVLVKNSNVDGDASWSDIPAAKTDTLGVIKVGDGLSVTEDGILSTVSKSLDFKILRNVTMRYFSVMGGYSSGVLDGFTENNIVIAAELIPGDNVSAYITHLQTSGNTVMMNAKNRENNADCTLETLTLNFILYI